jgi:hypothetical protein
MIRVTIGHGVVRMENGQLRDDLSRIWCSCGQPAVQHVEHDLPQYQWRCEGHKQEYEG